MITVIWHVAPYIFSQTFGVYVPEQTASHPETSTVSYRLQFCDNFTFGNNCIDVRDSRNAHKICVGKSRNK